MEWVVGLMVAKILESNGVYYCSNCRMRVKEPRYACEFCGLLFSNYEDILIKKFEEEEKEKE